MKTPLLLLVSLFLLSCNQKEQPTPTRIAPKQLAKTDSKFDVLQAYSISDSIDAIVFELTEFEEEKKFYDKIYDQVVLEDTLYDYSGEHNPALKPIHSSYVDTLGQFNILRSEKLEKRIKAKLKPTYYVYGTLGYTKVMLDKVYFTVDECISNIIAVQLKDYDRKKYGHPLFCSEKPLSLVYGKNYTKELKAIHQYDKKRALEVDYSNDPNSTKVVAQTGNYYFAYEDDFKWSRYFTQGSINFPSRSIYAINDQGKVDCIWGKCLDLFGIPCD